MVGPSQLEGRKRISIRRWDGYTYICRR